MTRVLVRLARSLHASLGRPQDGYTLFELLVAMVVGLVVASAAFTLIELSMKVSGHIEDRVAANQVGRGALQKITQLLHSGCVASGLEPVQAASDGTHLNFISSFGSGSGTQVTPTLHQITFNGTAPNGTLTDAMYASTGGTSSAWTFSSTPTATRTLLTNVSPVGVNGSPAASGPIFTYFAYSGGTLSGTPLSTASSGLTSATAATVVKVAVAFAASPSVANTSADGTASLSDSVVLRLSPASADPAATDLPCT